MLIKIASTVLELQSDIRKWFMKAHEKGNASAPKSTSSKAGPARNAAETAPLKSEQVRFLLYMFSMWCILVEHWIRYC